MAFWTRPAYMAIIALVIAVIGYFLTPRSRGGTILAVFIIAMIALLFNGPAGLLARLAHWCQAPFMHARSIDDLEAALDLSPAVDLVGHVDHVLGFVAAEEERAKEAAGGVLARRDQRLAEHQRCVRPRS